MENSEKALGYLKEKYSCSQSVFAAYADKLGIETKGVFKVAAGFGGGIGRTQDICGALTGAIMVLGCKYFDENNPAGSKDFVYNKVKKFIEKFKERNKYVDCYDLTGVDFKREEWKSLFAKLNIHEEKCNKYVKDACEILDEMM
jgi:C_GCAxxG_C_C family probable redox protein